MGTYNDLRNEFPSPPLFLFHFLDSPITSPTFLPPLLPIHHLPYSFPHLKFFALPYSWHLLPWKSMAQLHSASCQGGPNCTVENLRLLTYGIHFPCLSLPKLFSLSFLHKPSLLPTHPPTFYHIQISFIAHLYPQRVFKAPYCILLSSILPSKQSGSRGGVKTPMKGTLLQPALIMSPKGKGGGEAYCLTMPLSPKRNRRKEGGRGRGNLPNKLASCCLLQLRKAGSLSHRLGTTSLTLVGLTGSLLLVWSQKS